jgi:hypothetical protein
MMDTVISPIIVAVSVALVLGIAWALKFWTTVNEIPDEVSASVPIPGWIGLSGIATGFAFAYLSDYTLIGISSAVFGLGLWLPAAMVWIRNRGADRRVAEKREFVRSANASIGRE